MAENNEEIQLKKTKSKGFSDESMAEKSSLIKINNVGQFTYLGHVFDNRGVTSSTEHRKARASAKFHELREVLCDINVNRRTRWKLLEACVISRLLYGLQACYSKEDQTSLWIHFLVWG